MSTSPDWNVVVYAIARTSRELDQVKAAALAMHRALSTPRCNVVVQVNAKSGNGRYWISKGEELKFESFAEQVNAGNGQALADLLDATSQRYPGRATALVLWAHGAGLDHVHDYPDKRDDTSRFGEGAAGLRCAACATPIKLLPVDPAAMPAPEACNHASRGRAPVPPKLPHPHGCRWGPDPVSCQFLTSLALKEAIVRSCKRVEVLAINACSMASLEVEYELREVCDVLVGSQVDMLPWPYGALVTAMSSTVPASAEDFGRMMVATVRAEIAAGRRRDATSALRSDNAMDQLFDKFQIYAQQITALIETDWPSVRRAVATDVQRVDDPYQVDLASLISVLGNHDEQVRVAAAAVATQLESMVIANAAHASHPGVRGLSVFCPKSTHVDLREIYRGNRFHNSHWHKFLMRFQREARRVAAAELQGAGAGPGVAPRRTRSRAARGRATVSTDRSAP